MTTNIVTAAFGAFKVTRTRQLYQYDYGQILRFKGIDLPASYTVHFSNQQIGGNAVMRCVATALKEWARAQHLPGDPRLRSCWLCHVPQMRRRRSMDARTLDSLTREVLGTPTRPANQGAGPGTLLAAVPVGLFFHPDRMGFQEIGLLGARWWH